MFRSKIVPYLYRLLYLSVPHSYKLASFFGGNGLRTVVYHHVAEHSDIFTDLIGVTVHPEDLAWQLDTYSREYDVVDLDAVLSGKLPKRPLLITFDDCYRSVLDIAGPMLKKRGLPAVYFLSTNAISNDELMLDNLLCYLCHISSLPEVEKAITGCETHSLSLQNFIHDIVANLPYSILTGLKKKLSSYFSLDMVKLHHESNLYLNPDDVAKLTGYGFEVGNHTASHLHCRILDESDTYKEIYQAKSQLQEWAGTNVRAFSYPYGNSRDMTNITNAAVLNSGHEAVFLVHARAMSHKHRGPIWYRTSTQAKNPKQLFIDIEVLPRLRNFIALTL